jgi:hypothetical protein
MPEFLAHRPAIAHGVHSHKVWEGTPSPMFFK